VNEDTLKELVTIINDIGENGGYVNVMGADGKTFLCISRGGTNRKNETLPGAEITDGVLRVPCEHGCMRVATELIKGFSHGDSTHPDYSTAVPGNYA
jgi:hypothetical protein